MRIASIYELAAILAERNPPLFLSLITNVLLFIAFQTMPFISPPYRKRKRAIVPIMKPKPTPKTAANRQFCVMLPVV